MSSFRYDYRESLATHLREQSEQSLDAAYGLGRRAVTEGISLLELVGLHVEVTRAIARGDDGREAAGRFLIESLGTFDMAERGSRESRERAAVELERASVLGALADAHLAVVAERGVDARAAELQRWAQRLTSARAVTVELDESGTAEPRPPGPGAVAEPLVDLRGGTTGVLVAEPDGSFTESERRTLRQLSLLGGVALGDAQRFEREREIAVALQRNLLPAGVPTLERMQVTVRYVPAGIGSRVGGDWYDVFELSPGCVGLAVGDVMGHGIHGAALMVAVRVALRAVAHDEPFPNRALERLDGLLERFDDVHMTTVLFATLDLEADELTVANAGHPPPLLVDPRGNAEFLWAGRSIPLGVDPVARRSGTDPVVLDRPATILMFTDGLIEAAERAGDDGLAAVRKLATGFLGDPGDLCDRLLGGLSASEPNDDICLLAVKLAP